MRVAIPITNGRLAIHFGHCDQFALLDIDEINKKVLKREDLAAPPHQPGLLPCWLSEHGVNLVIAGGMGQRAAALFANQGIQVLIGAPVHTPEQLVNDYLNESLELGSNICDH